MAMTRISTAQVFDRANHNVSSARERELQSSEVAGSGKKILRPSEDPGGYSIAERAKESLSTSETIQKNAGLATSVLNVAENIFVQMQDVVQRCHELGVACASDHSSEARHHVKEEVSNLYRTAVQLLNTRYADRTLLAGFKSDGVAFDDDGNYRGDAGSIEIDVKPGLRIPINLSAERLVLGHGLKTGVNLLGAIRDLQDGLEADDVDAVRGSLDTLLRANDQVSLARGEIGSRRTAIDKAMQGLGVEKIEMIDSIAKLEEADAIQAFSDLARDQTVFKAAVSTTQKILNENPGDQLFK